MISKESLSCIPPALLSGLGTWAYTPNKKDPSKKGKTPFDPRTGRSLKPNCADTWLSFDDLLSAVSFDAKGVIGSTGRLYSGIGRVNQYNVNGIVAIDLDDVFDANGYLKAWAAEYIERAGSYAERSPSGRGLRIFVRGELPAELPVQSSYKIFPKGSLAGNPNSEVLLLVRKTYATITGDIFCPADVIKNQDFIDWLCAPAIKAGHSKPSKSSKHSNTTHTNCESLSTVTLPNNDAEQWEIDAAVEYLSRPEVCKFFSARRRGKTDRKDKSESGFMAGIIESVSRVGYREEIARGIWQRYCDRRGVKLDERKWQASWESRSLPQPTTNCGSLSGVTFLAGPTLPLPIEPADGSISLKFPAKYTITQRIQAIWYRALKAGLCVEEALWLTGAEIKASGANRVVTPGDVNHWQMRAVKFRRTRISDPTTLPKSEPGAAVKWVAELMRSGKKAKEIATITGIPYATVRKQMSRARKYGLASEDYTNPNQRESLSTVTLPKNRLNLDEFDLTSLAPQTPEEIITETLEIATVKYVNLCQPVIDSRTFAKSYPTLRKVWKMDRRYSISIRSTETFSAWSAWFLGLDPAVGGLLYMTLWTARDTDYGNQRKARFDAMTVLAAAA